MSRSVIYVEGGGDSAEQDIRCREGFSKLMEKAGLKGRMPRFVACGSRRNAYDGFQTAHSQGKAEYVALLVDSEDPVADLEKPWEHLANRKDDKMPRPAGATDEQALLMTTCMETWIVSDRAALGAAFRSDCYKEGALPPLNNLENRHRHDVQSRSETATKSCKNAYAKGNRSFEILAKLNPDVLAAHLPSFQRTVRILRAKL